MFVVTGNEIERMERKKDRYFRLANLDREIADQLFSAGSEDFIDPLKTACERYGAAIQIENELEKYKEQKNRYSLKNLAEHFRSFIMTETKQKFLGLILIIIGLLTIIPENDGTAAIVFVLIGFCLIMAKDHVIGWRY